ncbi:MULTISPECIES: cytidine deaminase [Maribacter]|uniref:Cytidine deaminase n=1 Tax=Maribacter flavus TaxID=1658664 RepID=A0A5B2TMW6_9FLAO|nr:MULTISPECIES: cytidine deaminase [Maribacter]KAA2215817.1 cytidine deaminase [Maribacter flavus]MDC6406371.1 cytidine deaminase [Maribacter sp. PR66]MEE1973491.1 cytidine deaminase [Maribacter flavus]
MAIKKKIGFDIVIYDSFEEMQEGDRMLLKKSVEARNNAYAPYSKFQVGAALKLENGEIVIGNNQENASYPSGLCAERVAVFYAGAKFPNVAIKTLAISVQSKNSEVLEPAAPCGNCRQSLFEYEHRQKSPIRILMMGAQGKVVECPSVAAILPLGFDKTYL